MRKVIYKYYVADLIFSHAMPRGAQFLSCKMQGGQPQMWWLIDLDEKEKEVRKFTAVLTGESFNAVGMNYLATFVDDDQRFVGHVFEVRQ